MFMTGVLCTVCGAHVYFKSDLDSHAMKLQRLIWFQ